MLQRVAGHSSFLDACFIGFYAGWYTNLAHYTEDAYYKLRGTRSTVAVLATGTRIELQISGLENPPTKCRQHKRAITLACASPRCRLLWCIFPERTSGCYGAYFQSALPVAMVQVSEALGLRPQLWLLWCKFPASPTRTYCNHQRSTAQLTINHRLQPITKPACSPLRCPPTSPTPSPDHKPAHHPHRAPIHQRTRHAIQRTPL